MTTIPVLLPFCYPADVVRRGHRKPEKFLVYATTLVSLRCVDSAPVVARWSGDNGRDDIVVEYRAMDGVLWESCFASDVFKDEPADPLTLAHPEKMLAKWAKRPFPDENEQFLHLFDWVANSRTSNRWRLEPAVENVLQVREWVRDEKDTAERELRDHAENNIAVAGGILHVRTKGPAWLVTSLPPVPNMDGPPMFVPGGGRVIEARRNIEQLMGDDRWDAWRGDRLAAAQHAWPDASRHYPDGLIRDNLEILDPVALVENSFDEHVEAFRVAAAMLVEGHTRDKLARFAPDDLVALADIKEVAAAGFPVEEMDRVETALRTIHRSFPEGPGNPHYLGRLIARLDRDREFEAAKIPAPG